MVMPDNKLNAINTYYSHVSRLFVSNYATFFAVYLAFLALLYNVSFRTEVSTSFRNGFFYVSVLIMFFELLLLYRGLQFGRVLDLIDKEWADLGILHVREHFWPEKSRIGQLNRLYRTVSVPLAMILTICIPVLSWFFLLRS
ncbi:MAG: hypothetical protein ABSD99_00350 [Candidatus Bathyarchaeia archaeon]|jgi:hypothetical protein